MADNLERKEQAAYVLDEQDQHELADLQLKLESLQKQITPLEGLLDRLSPSDLANHFHLGMVGRGGRASAKLNQKKLSAMERSFEVTNKLEPLYRERTRLSEMIEAVTSGRRRQQREKQAKREAGKIGAAAARGPGSRASSCSR